MIRPEFLQRLRDAGRFRLGLLCYPIQHSLSPAIFYELFHANGLHLCTYRRFPIKPSKLGMWLKRCKTDLIQGFNVSIPYKVSVISYLKDLSPQAKLIGAVNTVLVKPDGLYGENTDAIGFIEGMLPENREKLAGAHVLVLGSGGASRAVIYGLLNAGVSHLTIKVRDLNRAEQTLKVARWMNAELRDNAVGIQAEADWDTLPFEQYSMVVNTTPVGMVPEIYATPMARPLLAKLPEGAVVYDLVYNPFETILLNEARDLGLTGQDGLGMLLAQAKHAFERWTDITISPETLQAVRMKILTQYLAPLPTK